MRAAPASNHHRPLPGFWGTPTEGIVAGVLLAAISTTLMLESMRVFVSYTVFVVDESNRIALAAIVFGTILSIGMAGALIRGLGPAQSITLPLILLAISRIALQFWPLPEARLVLGAIAVIGWGWLMIALLSVAREAVALGIGFGLGLDLAIRIAAGTVDLPWMTGFAAGSITVLLAAAMIVASLRHKTTAYPSEPAPIRAASLIAIGPALALFHLMTGNLGLAQTVTGLMFPQAAYALALGTALGITGSVYITVNPCRTRRIAGSPYLTGILILIGSTSLWLTHNNSVLAPAGLAAITGVGLILLTQALLMRGRTAYRPGAGWTTVWFTLGMVLQVGIEFAYYTFTGLPVLIAVAFLLLAFATGIGGERPPVATTLPAPVLFIPATVVAVLLLSYGYHLITWTEPASGPPPAGELTVVTYNIQSGFAIDDTWNLERTARTIEAEHPDIVVLQEVSRGWLVTSGVDEAMWLSQRLAMPIVFGANSSDELWGNAILTRAPILDTASERYTVTENLKRSVVGVKLETQAGDLWVFGTHLDNPGNAEEVRLAQTHQLLEFVKGRSPALILGDLNSDPGDPVLSALNAAGFTDPGKLLRSGAFTSSDRRRIDYILVPPGVTVRDLHIPDSTASDHRPVVARIQLR